ncbi:MAG: DUF4412 domain-containing protein [Bacteroidota bacterium]
MNINIPHPIRLLYFHRHAATIAVAVVLVSASIALTESAAFGGNAGNLSPRDPSPGNPSSGEPMAFAAGESSNGPVVAETDSGEMFEGTLTISRYTVGPDGSEQRVPTTPLLIHPEYMMLLQSDGGSVEILGNIRAEGIVVRQKRQDFVFLTSDQKAVIMNKQELQQMIGMLESMQGHTGQEQQTEPEVTFHEAGDQKKIEGYLASKWIVSQDDRDSEWHIWVTEELSIPWGLLSEPWLTRQLSLSGLPAEQWFLDEKLPVRAELWSNGKLAEIVKIKDITNEPVPESRFEIPAGYQQITFQQMLFDRMRNRTP